MQQLGIALSLMDVKLLTIKRNTISHQSLPTAGELLKQEHRSLIRVYISNVLTMKVVLLRKSEGLLTVSTVNVDETI